MTGCVSETQLSLMIEGSIVGLPLIRPVLADFYRSTNLTYGLVDRARIDHLDPKKPNNPWKVIQGWWVKRSITVGDPDEATTTGIGSTNGLPLERVIRCLPADSLSNYQFRSDVFAFRQYPFSTDGFEQMLDELIQPLLTKPHLPAENESSSVPTLAELLHMAMAYDNDPADEVLHEYLSELNRNPVKQATLQKCEHFYGYLAIQPYDEVRPLVDRFRQAARGRMAGEPRLFEKDVDAVKRYIRAHIPLQLK